MLYQHLKKTFFKPPIFSIANSFLNKALTPKTTMLLFRWGHMHSWACNLKNIAPQKQNAN
jgi:hypothetical protein